MLRFRSLAAALSFVAAVALADDSPCAKNYRAIDASTSETTVEVAGRTPAAIVSRIAPRLAGAGVAINTSSPERGTLDAEGLTMRAVAEGAKTRVTFRSSAHADAATLCRYAALLVDEPLTNEIIVRMANAGAMPEVLLARIAGSNNPRFDLTPAAVQQLEQSGLAQSVLAAMAMRSGTSLQSAARSAAEMRRDLISMGDIVQPGTSGLNHAHFQKDEDFLELNVLDARALGANGVVYRVSMLVPRTVGNVANEALDDFATMAAEGKDAALRTQPIRIDATLVYMHDGPLWKLTDATITHIASAAK